MSQTSEANSHVEIPTSPHSEQESTQTNTVAPTLVTPPLNPAELSAARRRALKSDAHHLRPVVQIGQAGLTAGVIDATRVALAQHELIKVSINGESPTERKSGAEALGRATGAHVIQVIGRVIALYRKSERPKKSAPRELTANERKRARGNEQSVKNGKSNKSGSSKGRRSK